MEIPNGRTSCFTLLACILVLSAAVVLRAQVASITGPGQLVDSRRFEELPLRGRNSYALVIITGARNTFNSPRFQAPDNSSPSSAFGRARAQVNKPRTIQFRAKFIL